MLLCVLCACTHEHSLEYVIISYNNVYAFHISVQRAIFSNMSGTA